MHLSVLTLCWNFVTNSTTDRPIRKPTQIQFLIIKIINSVRLLVYNLTKWKVQTHQQIVKNLPVQDLVIWTSLNFYTIPREEHKKNKEWRGKNSHRILLGDNLLVY